MNLDKLN